MKKMVKRWISMLMVVLMTIAMVPMQAFASDTKITLHPSGISVNGVKVKVGDTVGGWSVVRINGSDIILTQGVYNQNNNYTFTMPYAADIWDLPDTVKNVKEISWTGTGGRSEGASASPHNGGGSAYYYFNTKTMYTHTLAFDKNCNDSVNNMPNSVSTRTEYMTDSLTIPSNRPSRNNYIFLGWAENANASEKKYAPNGSLTVSNTTKTLYAVWAAEHYSLKYNLDGGTGNFPEQTENNSTATSKTFTIHSGEPTKTDFDFAGWSDGTTTYQPEGSITLTSAAPSKTLTAQWTPKQTEAPKFTLTYIDRGNTYKEVEFTKGEELTIVDCTNTRNGYEFLGWSESSTASEAEYGVDDGITLEDSMTLYAVWRQKVDSREYTLTYNANGGDNAPVVQTANKGNNYTVTVSTDKPVWTNHKFLGWSTTEDGTVDSNYAAGSNVTLSSNVILYAVWENENTDPVTEYTITYKNGETVIETVTVSAGDDAKVKEAISDGEKEFLYWRGDDGKIYRQGQKITGIDKDYVLTAVWKGEELDPENPVDKVNKPGIDKKVDNADRTVVKPGDTVNFTLESNVPDNLSDYVDWEAAPWKMVETPTGGSGTATGSTTTDSGTQEPSVNAASVDAATVNEGTPAQHAETDEGAGSVSGKNTGVTKGSYVLTFHDFMSDGLEMKNDTLKVTIDGKELSLADGDYTFTTGTQKDGHECSFEISMDLVKLFNEKKFELNTTTEVRKILVTYSAIYHGTEGDEGDGFKSTNKAWVDYTDKEPDDPDTPHEVEVVTGSITVIKIDQDTREALEGAEFELYTDEAGTQKVGDTVTTDVDGKASFGKLAAGTYYLKESKAPEGYVGQKGLQIVTITEKDGEYLVTYEVPNKYVPHTGGAGTRMFTILGLAIMAGAGAAFVISRRKRED